MVVILEIVFLIVCAALSLWWFSRTSRWAQMKSNRERDHDLGSEKHALNRDQQELDRKRYRPDNAGPQYGDGQNYSGGAGF